MKRLGIVVIYDEEGILWNYLKFYIKTLRECVSELIVVINGAMSENGLEFLKNYSNKVYFRDNIGFDAGAYKDVFEKYLTVVQLEQYDEVILSNDTCFGPFVPFSDIFEAMAEKNVDFWGMNYVENNLFNHIQSNFLVFKKRTLYDLKMFFEQLTWEELFTIQEIYVKFETAIFDYFVERGYCFGHYAKIANLNVYKSPNYYVKEYNYPFMKKKCFCQKYYDIGNCLDALKYITEKTDYAIEYILEYIGKRYNITYEFGESMGEKIITTKYSIDIAKISDKEFKSFIMSNNLIFFYGAGIVARRVFWKYRKYLKNMKGFIVSDPNYEYGEVYGYPLYKLDNIDKTTTGIVVAMNANNTEEVRGKLQEYENVLYLW